MSPRVRDAATTDTLRLSRLPLNVIVLLPWTYYCYLEGISGEVVYSTETLLKLTFGLLLLRKLDIVFLPCYYVLASYLAVTPSARSSDSSYLSPKFATSLAYHSGLQTPRTLSMLLWHHRYVSKSDKKNATDILREAEERFRDELNSSEVAHLALM